ncbi:putative MFS transporter [Halenospora varia]|nr:putative MFS transporter [Halenospora varia]
MAIDKSVTSDSDSIICPSTFPCYGTQSPNSPVTVNTTTLDNSRRIGTGDNPFADPEIAELYRLLVWTPEEEKQIVRRIDWRECFWACDMLFALQLISKKIGPGRWIPTLITLWSIVGMSQAGLIGKNSFYATRAILGLLVGGFVPDIVLWLSYFYTSRELPIRLSFFWTSISLTCIITSFMGFGILHMRGLAFLLEGFITLLIGIASYFMMLASAVQTKAWYRLNGWFTAREEAIVVNRVLRDDPSKDIPPSPVGNYLTLILRSLGFSTVRNTPYVAHIITLLTITWLSERFNERTFFAMVQNLWILPCPLVLHLWFGVVKDAWGTYALVTVILNFPYSHAIIAGWASKDSNNVGTRSVSVTIYNIMVQAGNIYVADDAPLYRNGSWTLVIINCACFTMFSLTKLYYVLRNRHCDRISAAMSLERYEYTRYAKEIGSKRLDFRFAH